MTQTLRRRLLAVALFTISAVPAFAQQPPSPPFGQPTTPPFIWWRSDVFKRELALTHEQTQKVDKIWETTRPELRQEWEELNRLEEKFSRQLQSSAPDEAMLSRLIDRVETARANANKTRSLMLVQMRLTLTTEQRAKLDEIHARWLKDQEPPRAAAPRPTPTPRDSQKKPEE